MGETYKISEALGKEVLIKVNVDDEDAIERLGRVLDGTEAIGTVDASEAIADDGGLGVDSSLIVLEALGQVQACAFASDNLGGRKSPRASLVGIGGRDQVRLNLGDVGVGVRVLETGCRGVHRPSGDVNFLMLGASMGLEEGVHLSWLVTLD